MSFPKVFCIILANCWSLRRTFGPTIWPADLHATNVILDIMPQNEALETTGTARGNASISVQSLRKRIK